jgi:hypothetical protein
MGYSVANLKKVQMSLVGFTGDTLYLKEVIEIQVEFRKSPHLTTTMVKFLVVNISSAYNAILGRKTLNAIGAVIYPAFLKIKFPTSTDVGEECGHQLMARTCYAMSIKGKNSEEKKDKTKMISKEAFEIRYGEKISLDPKDSMESADTIESDDEVEEFVVDEGRKLNIRKALSGKSREDLIQFLVQNIDVFAWSASDMPGIHR